jgi:hypothetical protein
MDVGSLRQRRLSIGRTQLEYPSPRASTAETLGDINYRIMSSASSTVTFVSPGPSLLTAMAAALVVGSQRGECRGAARSVAPWTEPTKPSN